MCGCGGGGNRSRPNNVQRVRIVPTRPAVTTEPQPNASLTEKRGFASTPNTSDEQKKRINKLRRDAIKRAFGR